MDKKKIILIISILLIVSIVAMPSANAGILEDITEWFREILGIADNIIQVDSTQTISVLDFDNKHKFKNKIKTNDGIRVEDTFKRVTQYGTKHNINITNLGEAQIFNYKYSTIIEIKESEVRWNGTTYKLTSTPIRLDPFYEYNEVLKEEELMTPNIFFGENNRRINFKHIAELGGHAEVSLGKVELIIEGINIKEGETYTIDPTYYNQTDGIDVTKFNTAPNIHSLTTNGSDIWIPDKEDNWIYHINASGYNFTGALASNQSGFDIEPDGTPSPSLYGITTNGSDFWTADEDINTHWVYHVNNTGGNITLGFNSLTFDPVQVVSAQQGITTNGSDFWVLTANDDGYLLHLDATGTNLTGTQAGIDLENLSITAHDVTTNGSDFWITDDATNYLSHLDAKGNNMSDGIDLDNAVLGTTMEEPYAVAIYDKGFLEYESATPHGFFIYDKQDKFIYHLSTDEPLYPHVRNQFPLDVTKDYTQSVNFTYNVTDPEADVLANCSLWLKHSYNEDFVRLETDYTVTQVINQSINVTLEDQNLYWKIGCYDINHYQGNSTAFNFTVDTTAPVVNLSIGLIDLVNTTLPDINHWYYNVTDNHSQLDECWYYTSEDTTNQTITCNLNTTTSWNEEGLKWVYHCANDSGGWEACNLDYLNMYYYNYTQSVNKETIGEGDSAIFSLVINMTNLEANYEQTYAYLNYNNTLYTPTKIQHAHNYTFTHSIIIPTGTGSLAGQNVNWSWNYAIQNTTDILVNDSTYNQTQKVYSMEIDDCSVLTREIANYTLHDEETKANITGSIDNYVYINSFLDTSINWNYSRENINRRSTRICISNNILDYSDYNLDITTRYDADNHEVEYHYVDNFNLTSSSLSQNFSLYDLDSTNSTSFLINYKDEFYIFVEGAIIDIHRFYVGDGIYRSVEMGKTNDAGQTRAHLVTEDVKYMFYVRVNGSLVYTSPEYLALCQTAPCEIQLYEISDTSSEYTKFGNIQYTFDLNEDTRTVKLTFATNDGTASVIKMNVTEMDNYLNETVCEETQSSSGGILTCVVPQAYDNMTYQVLLLENGVFITQRFLDLNPGAYDIFGYTGVFLSFIVIATLVFMSFTSGIAMVFFAIIGVIVVGLMNLLDVGNIIGVGSAVIWLFVAGIIIIYKISQRRYH